MQMELSLWLLLSFFGVAFLYASVGFGGGSSYLAILTLAGMSYLMLRPAALSCNLVVVGGSVFLFIKEGILPWKKVLPLVALSVPLAALGGALQLNKSTYFPLLGGLLVLAAAGMFVQACYKVRVADAAEPAVRNSLWHLIVGGCIGFVSGLVGIGGGIFLAPLLHLSDWDRPRVIAASASFFILVNSVAGLAGLVWKDAFVVDWQVVGLLAAAVLLGGQLGSRMTLRWFSPTLIRVLTALLILMVGGRLLLL